MDEAIITGGCNELGSGFASALSRGGYRVTATTRSSEKAAEFGGEAAYDECTVLDLSEFDSIHNFFRKRSETRVLVNLAVARFPVRDNEEYGWTEWERELKINLGATYKASVEAAKQMREAGFGRIINIGSVYGKVAVDHRVYPPGMDHTHIVYSVSKAGIIQMTRELASMWAGTGVTVNCLSFGGLEDDQPKRFKEEYSQKVPMGRMGATDEVIPALRFLISKDNSYFTGQNILVDGGLSVW